jgi:hypothetical protein
MRSKLIALLLALVLAFGGLTACGSNNSGEGAPLNGGGQVEGGDDQGGDDQDGDQGDDVQNDDQGGDQDDY